MWINEKDKKPEFDKLVLVWCRIYGRYLSKYVRVADSDWGQWMDPEGRPGGLPPIYWADILDAPYNQE